MQVLVGGLAVCPSAMEDSGPSWSSQSVVGIYSVRVCGAALPTGIATVPLLLPRASLSIILQQLRAQPGGVWQLKDAVGGRRVDNRGEGKVTNTAHVEKGSLGLVTGLLFTEEPKFPVQSLVFPLQQMSIVDI